MRWTGRRRLGLDLRPQPADVDVDGARVAVVVRAPDPVEQLAARVGPARDGRPASRAGRTPWVAGGRSARRGAARGRRGPARGRRRRGIGSVGRAGALRSSSSARRPSSSSGSIEPGSDVVEAEAERMQPRLDGVDRPRGGRSAGSVGGAARAPGDRAMPDVAGGSVTTAMCGRARSRSATNAVAIGDRRDRVAGSATGPARRSRGRSRSVGPRGRGWAARSCRHRPLPPITGCSAVR